MAMLAMIGAALPAAAAEPEKRIAVISAFEPEWIALQAAMTGKSEQLINGTRFLSGTLGGKKVVLFLSGVSMTNAAMTTQLALDRFPIRSIVFSGVAGGIDPKLDVGDVVVADKWTEYLESAFARATPAGFVPPDRDDGAAGLPAYGMMYPRTIGVRHPVSGAYERRTWFDADPAMIAVARAMPPVTLRRCSKTLCLKAQPRVVVGGHGVSGPVFMDNAEYRQYLFKTFDAQVLDMESAAVAHVAYSNAVPFIAFRSLSDLAGGDPGENQARAFYPLASENSALVVTAFLKALPD
ncbi:5'-methylthioadenosine/S-adenosylhomocysteine nucleosidase [Sphingomonas sp. BIUV-7]|uniref:5'-methylthioadenosine/S-adenosylhomocysteine nucleosidase n=1 Tax=Sphingomonas natans TaxID=3063330 RepID=A0ABT8YDE3_9SPHN|nr:5'-methylthioadenosine/S-adenosylhomocysteine nucleosidase [Sphingomonas sp. BIUV-7]MDO6415962.1 5'-methylthioadenosine/S-adenosylhomocysteine nucleosidase [Sphingomonas sp. BIUV-7]